VFSRLVSSGTSLDYEAAMALRPRKANSYHLISSIAYHLTSPTSAIQKEAFYEEVLDHHFSTTSCFWNEWNLPS
jgi:hypothetical protein